MLKLPHRDPSKEYPQSMFWNKNKTNRIPLYTPLYIKVGLKGVNVSWTCFPDVTTHLNLLNAMFVTTWFFNGHFSMFMSHILIAVVQKYL